MDYAFEYLYSSNFVLWITVLLSVAIFALLTKPRLNLPPGPRGLPFVGYFPFLTNEPHLKLHELSKKYGDIFGLYLGNTYVVVVSDCSVAKELFNKADSADRPPELFHSMPDGLGLADINGQEWVDQRRYTSQKMKNLGFGKSEWEKLVQDEMQNLVDILRQTGGQPFDVLKPLAASISNNTLSLVSGQRLPVGDPRRDIVDLGIESFQKFFTQSSISLYPRLYSVALKLGLVNGAGKMQDLVEMNRYIRNLVRESKNSDDHQTYIQEYLKEIKERNDSITKTSFNERNLIGNAQALIIGGSDTAKMSLIWLFCAMASYSDIQDRVHQELDSVLESNDDPSGWVDRAKLPYCHATILEGQRWRTIAPMNVLHRTNKDIAIRDYVIPKNSNIIGFLWAFHNNDRFWTDPDKFQPDRFLSEEGKVMTKMDNFAPFSFGKRSCIGETVALIELFVYFVGIMKRFRILPEREDEPLNLKGTMGLTLQPPRQQLRYVPR